MGNLDEAGDKRRALTLLSRDLELIRRYAETHQEDWAGVRFRNEPSLTLVAAFSRDVDSHREALRRLVEHPDHLQVEELPRSLAELNAVGDEIKRTAATGAIVGIGKRWGRLHVRLRADQEDMAARLLDRYGDSVELEVGAFPYPMPAGLSVPPVRRSPHEQVSIDGLEARLDLDARTVHAGHQGRATVELHYTGTQRAGPLHSGQPLVAVLVDEHGREAGGLGNVAIAGTGLFIDLQPDERLRVPVLYGTASLRSDWGYMVPPGHYWVKTEVPIQGTLPGVPTQALSVPAEELIVVARGRGEHTQAVMP